MENNLSEDKDTLVIEEIQFLLQEKRTALKIIRIGVAVFVAQMAVAGYVLTALKRHIFSPSVYAQDILAAAGIVILSITIGMMVGPAIRIGRLNRKILNFEKRHKRPLMWVVRNAGVEDGDKAD